MAESKAHRHELSCWHSRKEMSTIEKHELENIFKSTQRMIQISMRRQSGRGKSKQEKNKSIRTDGSLQRGSDSLHASIHDLNQPPAPQNGCIKPGAGKQSLDFIKQILADNLHIQMTGNSSISRKINHKEQSD